MKKKILIALVIMVSMYAPVYAAGTTVQAALSNLKITIQGKEYNSNSPMLLYKGKTYVPIVEYTRELKSYISVDYKNNAVTVYTGASAVEDYMKQINMVLSFCHQTYSLTSLDSVLSDEITYSISSRSYDKEYLEKYYSILSNAYNKIEPQVKTMHTISRNANLYFDVDKIMENYSTGLSNYRTAIDGLYSNDMTKAMTYTKLAINNFSNANSLVDSEFYRISNIVENYDFVLY